MNNMRNKSKCLTTTLNINMEKVTYNWKSRAINLNAASFKQLPKANIDDFPMNWKFRLTYRLNNRLIRNPLWFMVTFKRHGQWHRRVFNIWVNCQNKVNDKLEKGKEQLLNLKREPTRFNPLPDMDAFWHIWEKQ